MLSLLCLTSHLPHAYTRNPTTAQDNWKEIKVMSWTHVRFETSVVRSERECWEGYREGRRGWGGGVGDHGDCWRMPGLLTIYCNNTGQFHAGALLSTCPTNMPQLCWYVFWLAPSLAVSYSTQSSCLPLLSPIPQLQSSPVPAITTAQFSTASSR